MPSGWDERLKHFRTRVREALAYTLARQRLSLSERTTRIEATEAWLSTLTVQGFRIWREQREALWNAEEHRLPKGRAEGLLRNALSPFQRKELDRRGYFHVCVGTRRFRITRGRSGNVLEVDVRSRVLRSFCAHPIEEVPDADTMLSQKLLLDHQPEDFFRIANVQRAPRSPTSFRNQLGRALQEARYVGDALDVTAISERSIPIDL